MCNTDAEYIAYTFKYIKLVINDEVIFGADDEGNVGRNYEFVSYKVAQEI